jgi:streptomycin 6-kinase
MNQHFKNNALTWGKQGADWLARIPAIISECEQKWDIRVQEPFALSYNYVAPAELSDGSLAVLKIGFPGDKEFKTEIDALELFNGEGVCKLLKADRVNSAMLIEKITPGIPLSSLHNDDEATKVLGTVITRIHKPLPEQHRFITIEEWTTAIPEYLTKHKSSKGPLPAMLVDKAKELFKHLITTSTESVLVHGDLHHDNVLLSAYRGWLAIDPKGVAAEPAYEVAAMIRNPYERLKNIKDLEPMLNRRIAILSEMLEFKRQRILDWCFAQTMLSAVWNTEGEKSPEHALRVAQVLDKMNT